jgi:mannitol-1-/sugar-/sorbitol-6-phosphatase
MTRIVCAAFLFDMDGVLVDSTPAVARVWANWASKHGFDPVETTKRAHGRPCIATLRELLPDASKHVLERENAWMEEEEIADVSDVVALPGTVELLSTLAGGQFAVVTSAVKPLAEVRLGASNLLKYVINMVSADEIHHGKPDPEPYLKGAEKLHLRPQDCIVIEDAPSGVRSGKAAGSRVIALRTTTPDEELLEAGADWIVNDCAAVRLISSPGHTEIAFELFDSPENRRVPKMS